MKEAACSGKTADVSTADERSESRSAARSSGGSAARLPERPEVPRRPRPEQAGAFTLFAVQTVSAAVVGVFAVETVAVSVPSLVRNNSQ